MSLRPYFRTFWDEPWEGMTVPSRLHDQHFGNMITDEFIRPPLGFVHPLMMPPPMHAMQPPKNTGISEVTNSDKEFRVCMDVRHFKPEELSIKTKDNRVIINAKHEERPDGHGLIRREFTRQYVLPKDVDPATVTCSLSREGMLTLKAPKVTLEAPKETSIPITMETTEQSV